MVQVPTEITAIEEAHRRLQERVASIETVLLVIPILLAEILLVLSLFLPFVTTEVSNDEVTVNLIGLIGGLFGGDSAGAADVAFGVAFVLLVIVIVGSIVSLPLLARRGVKARAAGVALIFGILLVLGTLGAWAVTAIGIGGEDPDWIMGPSIALLTAGALLTALLVFLPAYRAIWSD